MNHLNRDYLFLQVEQVSKEYLDKVKSNVILEIGSIFQEIETKKLFKHKIVILDQVIYVQILNNFLLAEYVHKFME
jgi:hypothetical protein